MPDAIKLAPVERARLEAMRDEIGPHHPYRRDGFRGLFASKEAARKERKKIEQAAKAWRELDHRTKDWLRWMTAHSILDTLSEGSDAGLAEAVRSMSDEQRSRTLAEVADGARYGNEDGRPELTDEFVDESMDEGRDRPLDPAPLLDDCHEALLLPSGAKEEKPSLRRIAAELYVFWQRDHWLPGDAKLPEKAIEAVALEIAHLYGLSPAEAMRRSRTALLELDRNDQLPPH